MIPSEGLVEDLAGAILDGTPIDWASAESGGGAVDRALLERLKVLSTLADLHREDSAEPPEPQPVAGAAGQDVPDRWGPLQVLERLGRGSFGDVYRAWDTNLDREVALKLLPAQSPDERACADSVVDEGHPCFASPGDTSKPSVPRFEALLRKYRLDD